jgi:tRNA (adenine22-N1)-methyltransferase
MKLPISDRLLACAGFVKRGSRVADIGCDHGYLSIHLLTNGIAASCIASDVNEGPLQSAQRNARKFGVANKIEFYLSDGVGNIPRDFDCMVCAGMGADTMVHILEDAPWLKDSRYTLILQCQSKIPMLRCYLSENGWQISEEAVLRDGRFLYTIMNVRYCPEAAALSIGQCYFSPALLVNPSSDVPAYYKWVVDGLRISTAHQDDPEKKQILAELKALAETPELTWLKEEAK